jgi:hypothetical protein
MTQKSAVLIYFAVEAWYHTHDRVHKSPPCFPMLSQINSASDLQTDILKINFNIALPSIPRSSKVSHSLTYPSKTLFSPIRATRLSSLTALGMIAEVSDH